VTSRGGEFVGGETGGKMTGNRWTLLLCVREQANNHIKLIKHT